MKLVLLALLALMAPFPRDRYGHRYVKDLHTQFTSGALDNLDDLWTHRPTNVPTNGCVYGDYDGNALVVTKIEYEPVTTGAGPSCPPEAIGAASFVDGESPYGVQGIHDILDLHKDWVTWIVVPRPHYRHIYMWGPAPHGSASGAYRDL